MQELKISRTNSLYPNKRAEVWKMPEHDKLKPPVIWYGIYLEVNARMNFTLLGKQISLPLTEYKKEERKQSNLI